MDGIPVTTPSRTLLDEAAVLARRGLERALDRAEVLELFDLRALHAAVDAHPGHHGAGALARALRDHEAGTTLTRSELEERFLALCEAHGIPRPRVNARVAGLEVDFLPVPVREADMGIRGRAARRRGRRVPLPSRPRGVRA